MKITHYDLFAGIGGFSLALDTVFYDKEIKHIFCEWEAFPTAVLKKHWPNGTYYGDIADLVTDTASEGLERSTGEKLPGGSNGLTRGGNDLKILTGGFPCQPFSHAGRRQGTADDRYKWPDMFAVIQNVRPDWVIAENVRGLVTWNEGMVLETVCTDLESEGYEVQPIVIPAVAVGAPHRRDRVWIVAQNTNNNGGREGKYEKSFNKWVVGDIISGDEIGLHLQSDASDPRQQLRSERSGEGVEADTTIGATRPEANQREQQYTWADDWREVALTTCHDGVDDGLPRKMDGTTISASRHRKERLKACGNAIVPQVAMEIFAAIREAQTIIKSLSSMTPNIKNHAPSCPVTPCVCEEIPEDMYTKDSEWSQCNDCFDGDHDKCTHKCKCCTENSETPKGKSLDGHSIAGTSEWRERIENDYYATPTESTEALLEVEEIIYPAWEPACGEGHIAKLLTGEVYASDLIERGYGTQEDFLTTNKQYATIITNPPFNLFQEFAEHALELATHKVILFGKLQALEGKKRATFMENSPLKTVYVFKSRQNPLRNGSPVDENGKPWASTMAFAWYVWEIGYEGLPTIKWLT